MQRAREPAPPEIPSQPPHEAASRRSLEEELQRQRQASARLESELRRLSRPQAAALISLGIVRGEGSSPDGPGIRLGSATGWAVLSVELPAAEFSAYRATLLDSEGKALWRVDRLEPSLYETLLINVPSSFLPPGSYRLRLEGLGAGSVSTLAGDVPFRVLPP